MARMASRGQHEAPPRKVVAPNPSPMTFRGTNTWIVGQGRVAIIDPGPADPRHLDAILAALGPSETVSHILVTHAHADHSGLAPALSRKTNAPILAFGKARDGMRTELSAQSINMLPEGDGLDLNFVPDGLLRDGDILDGADWKIEAIHTPGHLGSHLCFAWNDTCFSGDHIMGWATSVVSPPEGHMGDYMQSLTRLAQKHWRRLYPGHGDVIADPSARIAELLAHRRGRENSILAALAQEPSSLADLTSALYRETPAALHPAAARNVLAHLLDLAERQVVGSHQESGLPAIFYLC